MDDEGYSSVRPDFERLEDVPDRIAAAIAHCPERAITLRQA